MDYNEINLIKKISSKIKNYNLTSERFKYRDMGDHAKEDLDEAKQKQRTDMKLEDWKKYKYYLSNWCEKMLKNELESVMRISYENYEDLSKEEFIEKYEKLNKPLIIKGGTQNWAANKNWTFEKLYENFKESKVKVGEDDSGYKIKIQFKYFLEYLIYNEDDSPLYLFESSIENHKHLKDLMADYKVPKYFKEDLFNLVGEDRRPPYRWFLMGPERSGTALHIDPLGTSAWNASICGHKLWLLLPPETPKHIAKGKEVINKDEDDEAIMYFVNIFPRIKEKYKDQIKEMIFIQNPGEIVFIPGGWWHVVVNLDDTVAITQNYCNSVNFEIVWLRVRNERKKMAVRFLKKLKELRPDLFKQAILLNQKDNFNMLSYEDYMLNKKRHNENLSRDDSSSSSSSSSSLEIEDFKI